MPQEWLSGREARERENGQESSHSKPSVVCVCVCVDELTKSAWGSTTILLFYRCEEIEFQEETLKKKPLVTGLCCLSPCPPLQLQDVPVSLTEGFLSPPEASELSPASHTCHS